MPEITHSLFILILGWLLGLLAPAIVDLIKRGRENKLGRDAIKHELNDLHVKLIFSVLRIEEHQGKLNSENLDWFVKQMNRHKHQPNLNKIYTTYHQLLNLSEDQLEIIAAARKSKDGISLTLQKYATPLLDSRVAALWSFETNDQRVLLELRSVIDIMAEIVDRARHFTNLTFTKLENGNYDLVVDNITGCYQQYAIQAMRAAELIQDFSN